MNRGEFNEFLASISLNYFNFVLIAFIISKSALYSYLYLEYKRSEMKNAIITKIVKINTYR